MTTANAVTRRELAEARQRAGDAEERAAHAEMRMREMLDELARTTRGHFVALAELETLRAKLAKDDSPGEHSRLDDMTHERGWQWRPVGDGAFAPPFGTIHVCRACGCLVAGGPTACGRCVAAEERKDA